MVRAIYWDWDRLRIEAMEAEEGFEAGGRSTNCDRAAGDGADVHVIGWGHTLLGLDDIGAGTVFTHNLIVEEIDD